MPPDAATLNAFGRTKNVTGFGAVSGFVGALECTVRAHNTHNTHKLQQSIDASRAGLEVGGGAGSCVVAIWHERM